MLTTILTKNIELINKYGRSSDAIMPNAVIDHITGQFNESDFG